MANLGYLYSINGNFILMVAQLYRKLCNYKYENYSN